MPHLACWHNPKSKGATPQQLIVSLGRVQALCQPLASIRMKAFHRWDPAYSLGGPALGRLQPRLCRGFSFEVTLGKYF